MRFLGVDLVWSEGTAKKAANETGVAALDESGKFLDAGWTAGLNETATWIEDLANDDTLLFIDSPLLVHNASGMRLCDRQVGRCYGRWQVYANAVPLGMKNLGWPAWRLMSWCRVPWRDSRSDDGFRGDGRSSCGSTVPMLATKGAKPLFSCSQAARSRARSSQ